MLVSEIVSRASADAPLIILVHGRSGTVKVMQAFKSVMPANVNVVSVQAPYDDPEGGYRWWDFKSEEKFSEGAESGAAAATKIFIEWLENFKIQESLTPRSIVGVGFSQGAALLSYMAQLHQNLLKGVAMLAGFVVSPKENIVSSGSRPEFFMAHGESDQIVPITIAREGAECLKGKGYQIEFIADAVGHKIGVKAMPALRAWLDKVVV